MQVGLSRLGRVARRPPSSLLKKSNLERVAEDERSEPPVSRVLGAHFRSTPATQFGFSTGC